MKLIEDKDKIEVVRKQIKMAEDYYVECEKNGETLSVEAWHGYIQALRWVLEHEIIKE